MEGIYADLSAPQWAPPVRRQMIRRLYEADAAGLGKDSLVNEVGYAVFFRCESIHRVTERLCPQCGSRLSGVEGSVERDRPISCQGCGWKSTWRIYHRSYKGKRLHGGGAYPAFARFYNEFPKCRTADEKMLAIDRVIHAIHRIGAPGIVNLIRCHLGVAVAFLDDLAYGDTVDPDRAAVRAEYQQNMAHE